MFVERFVSSLDAFPDRITSTFAGDGAAPLLLAEPKVLPDITREPTKDITIRLRSIRKPKFQIEYTLPETETVFALKERLQSDPANPLADTAASPLSLKLMHKSKVVPDVFQLSQLLPNPDLVVMVSSNAQSAYRVPAEVYWPKESDLKNEVNLPQQESPATTAPKPRKTLPREAWDEIYSVLAKYLPEEHSSELLSSFQGVGR